MSLWTIACQAPLISQARILEWVTFPAPGDLSNTGIKPIISCIGSGILPSVQFSSVAQPCLTLCYPWTAACQASLSIINSQSLLKLKSINLMMPSNHFILCHPLVFLPSIFPSIRVFSNESVLRIRRPKYWSFSFSISPSNEYSGLISFRIDWLDLLVVQGALKSHLQHHNSKASILQCSAFFIGSLYRISLYRNLYMGFYLYIGISNWNLYGNSTLDKAIVNIKS